MRNGGSSSDAEHTVAELMKSFEIRRPLDKSFKERLAIIDENAADTWLKT